MIIIFFCIKKEVKHEDFARENLSRFKSDFEQEIKIFTFIFSNLKNLWIKHKIIVSVFLSNNFNANKKLFNSTWIVVYKTWI